MKKKHIIIPVSTKKKMPLFTDFIFYYNKDLLIGQKDEETSKLDDIVDLYILSNEKPKVGDYSINLNSIYIYKELCRIDNEIELESYAYNKNNDCRKVIATTNTELELPLIPQSFVHKYVQEFKDNKIEEVMVEYNEIGKDYLEKGENSLKLKVDIGNQITITTCKDNWSREEVIELLHRVVNSYMDYQHISWEKWIEENL